MFYSAECVEGEFSEVRRHGVLRAGFSGRDPHCMMHKFALYVGIV
jgi:hypothetical protein